VSQKEGMKEMNFFVKRIKQFLVLSSAVLLMLSSNSLLAQSFTMKKNEWKLVSFYELPKYTDPNSSILVAGNGVIDILNQAIKDKVITSVWSYETAGDSSLWRYWINETAEQAASGQNNDAHPDVPGIPENDSTPSKITSNLSHLEYGKSYWVRGRVSGTVNFDVASDNLKPFTAVELAAGWNMIGFPIQKPVTYDFAFAGVKYSQIWRYNNELNRFESIERGNGSVVEEDFNRLEPGVGYWVLADEPATLAPKLKTILPGDVDESPFIEVPDGHKYGNSIPASAWTKNSNDIDYDQCGDYDYPESQRILSMGDFVETQNLTIANDKAGVLNWRAKVVACTSEFDPCLENGGSGSNAGNSQGFNGDTSEHEWLSFRQRQFNAEKGIDEFIFVSEVSGSNTQIDTSLVLHAERAGLIADKKYSACIEIQHNSVDSTEPRRIVVDMDVPDLIGDYEVKVKLERLIYNGEVKEIEQHNPQYFLSLLRDGNNFKGMLDDERSMLITELTYLNGFDLRNPEANFQLFGRLQVPKRPNATSENPLPEYYNPFNSDILREFSLIGRRGMPEDNLTSKDLVGDYSENVYGLSGDDAIRLEGTFIARRISDKPKRKDQVDKVDPTTQIIERGEKDYPLTINQRVAISDLILSLDIAGLDPEKVVVSIFPPWINHELDNANGIVLHNRSAQFLNNISYPDQREPFESLDVLYGQVATGEWNLRIRNEDATEGQLISWGLEIEGTNRYQSIIEVDLQYLGLNITLNGCGVNLVAAVETRTINGDTITGAFFDGLIPCDYTVTINSLGYQSFSTDISVKDCRAIPAHVGDPKTSCEKSETYTIKETIENENIIPVAGNRKVLVSPLQTEDVAGIDMGFEIGLQGINNLTAGADYFLKLYRRGATEGTIEGSPIVSTDYQVGKNTLTMGSNIPNRPGTYVIVLTDNAGAFIATSDDIKILNTQIRWTGEHEQTLKIQFSTHASGGVFMDSATFDIDRPDYAVGNNDHIKNNQLNDSDCFKENLPNIDENRRNNPYTNEPKLNPQNESFDGRGCMASIRLEEEPINGKPVTPKNIDDVNVPENTDSNIPLDDTKRHHYHAYISTGQPFVGGSGYGSVFAPDEEDANQIKRYNFRLDSGIQAQSKSLKK